MQAPSQLCLCYIFNELELFEIQTISQQLPILIKQFNEFKY